MILKLSGYCDELFHADDVDTTKMSRKVEPVVEVFNDISKNVLVTSGGFSLDETLAPYHGRNGVHTKIYRKPAGEGFHYNNVCSSKVRYSHSLVLQRTATEKKWNKAKLVDQMVGEKLKEKGLVF